MSMVSTPTPAATPAPSVLAPTNAGTPDTSAFNEALTNNNQAKAAALAALAAGGTAGLQAHLAAQAGLSSDRTNAVNAQMAAVHAVGAPSGAAAALAQPLNAPFDQYAMTNQALQQAGQQADAARSAAAGTYFNEANAAVPIIRAQAEGKLALARQAASQTAQLHDIALQTAQARLANASASGLGPNGYADVGKIVASLGGAQIAGQQFNQQASQMDSQLLGAAQKQSQGNVAAGAGTGPSGTGGGNFNPALIDQSQTDPQVYAQIDAQYNLPPGTSQALATQAEGNSFTKGVVTPAKNQAAATKAANAPPSTAAIENTADYKTLETKTLQMLSNPAKPPGAKNPGPSFSAWVRALVQSGADPATIGALETKYQSQFKNP